jgi:hypothetical protein
MADDKKETPGFRFQNDSGWNPPNHDSFTLQAGSGLRDDETLEIIKAGQRVVSHDPDEEFWKAVFLTALKKCKATWEMDTVLADTAKSVADRAEAFLKERRKG